MLLLPFVRAGLVLLATAAPSLAQSELARFVPLQTDGSSAYGTNVDATLTTAVVGHRGYGGLMRAAVFEKVGSVWQRLQVLAAGPFPSGHAHVPVAIDGDAIMVGNFREAGGEGRVYVHERVAGVFQNTQVLSPSVAVPDSDFGRRIVIDGDRAAIAAPMDATFAYRGGAVFIFDRIAGVWQQTARIEAPEMNAFAFFGLGMDLDGDTLVVGQPGLITWGYPAYPTYVYERQPGGAWVIETSIGPTANTHGYRVGIDGDRIVVGTYGQRTIDIFRKTRGVWRKTQAITHPDRPISLSMDFEGDTLVAGWGSSEIGGGGGASVYHDNGGTFELSGPVQRAVPSFGRAVAISGDELWLGAPSEEDPTAPQWGWADVGAAYVYSIPFQSTSDCGPTLPNSVGELADLYFQGVPYINDSGFRLQGEGIPPLASALALVGTQPVMVPMAGGGFGTLCVGGDLGRYDPQSATLGGTVSFAVDLRSIPSSATGLASAMSGERFYFQAWYRDAQAFGGSNLSDVVSVVAR